MPSTTSIIEQVTWQGILSLPMSVLLGCAIALLLIMSLIREFHLLRRWTFGFAMLRLIAVAVVLWMLLGPALETRSEITTPQSIALLVDDSGSMSTHDPNEPRHNARWAAANNMATHLSAIANVDRASISAEAAVKQWDQVATSLQMGREQAVILDQLEEAESLSRGSDRHMSQCSRDRRDESRIERIREELKHIHVVLLPEIRKRIRTSKPEDYLSGTISSEVSAIRQRLQQTLVRQRRLCLDWVLESGQTPAVSGNRRQLVDGLLDGLETGVMEELDDTLRIQRYRFSDSLTKVEGPRWSHDEQEENPNPKLTDVSLALQYVANAANSESLAAAILFSDGGHNVMGGASPKQVAASLGGIPIHVVPVGSTARVRDIVFQSVSAPSTVKLEDSILLSATIAGFECKGEVSEIVLRRDGVEMERRPVSFQNDRQSIRATFECPAGELGRHEFELSVLPIEDEVSQENNLSLSTVNVVRNRLRVLLADGRPRWEYRYLEHLFSRDPSVDFDQLLFLPRIVATGARRATGRVPETADGYAHYDIVILGDLSPRQLTPQSQSALAEFVRERGGNVVVAAGRHHMPESFERQTLLPLLPVQEGIHRSDLQTAYTARLSQDGEQHEAVMIAETRGANRQRWADQFRNQPFYFVSRFHRAKPAAHTLIESVALDSQIASVGDSDIAMLSWHQVGAGKVVFLSSPATYHLRNRSGDRMHHRFWGQLLRWLTSSRAGTDSDRIPLTTDDVRYQIGEPINVRLVLSDPDGHPIPNASIGVSAVSQGKQVASIELTADEIPGRYIGEFRALPAGAYRLIPQGDVVDRLLELTSRNDSRDSFAGDRKLLNVAALVNVVSETNLEMADTRCNHALLREIAEESGGLVVPPTAVDEIVRISAVAPTVTENIERQPLWNRWRYLWLVIGCVSLEWFVRKSKGLL